MRWPEVLVVVAALAAACRDPEITQLENVKKQVCTCKDIACAEAAMKTVPQGDIKATHREQVIARDMLDCLAKLYDAAKPPPAE